jgi:hypothetical protein
MKKEYIAPELEVVRFTTEDVITASSDEVFETPFPGDQP